MNYGTATRFSPEHVLRLAEQFFGPDGLGLSVDARRPDSMALSGPRRQVAVGVQTVDGTTEVSLTTKGLDHEVRQFMVGIYEEAHLHAGG